MKCYLKWYKSREDENGSEEYMLKVIIMDILMVKIDKVNINTVITRVFL